MLTVSVIILAEGKGRLDRALDSALAQDFADLEVVLVVRNPSLKADAITRGRDVLVVAPDESLSRAAAANAGLDASRGEWVVIVDENDWLSPTHVSGLVAGAEHAKDNLLVYRGIRLHDGQTTRVSSPGYWRQTLCEKPLIQSCAILFSRSLVQRHACRFDTQFVLFDDWDFLLQCAEHTDFFRVSGETAHHEDSARKLRENSVNANLARLGKKWGSRYGEIRALANGAAHQASDAIKRNAPDEVMTPLEVALQVDPGNPLLLNQLAWCLRQKGDLPGALRALRRACDSDPTSAALLGDRVVLEHRLGMVDSARKSFVKLVEQSGTEQEWARMKAIGAFIGAEISE